MLLRLAPAVFAIYALYQPWANGTQLVTEDSERKVKKIMEIYRIPDELEPRIYEYIEKKRAWKELKFEDIEDILYNRRPPTSTIESIQLSTKEAAFATSAIG